ncbi:MAG: trans-sulfuration enzyme family protein, partial [Mycobacteriales bacterium]
SGLLAQLADRFGIEVSTVDTGRPGAISAAAGPATRLVYVETLSNPLVRVTDLPRAATEAHDAGTLLVVDNTFASPVLCRPIEHGADIVVHSLTKYIGGHSDLIAGAAVFADAEVGRRCADWQATEGAVADPFACWLTLRGIKTLPLRIRHAAASADAIARMAAAHPGVSTVHWPGLPGHPDHEIAARIASPPGGVLGIDVDGGMAAADRFQRAVRVAVLSGSLGGPETLVLHPATTSHRNATPAELRQAGIGAGTVRIAVGLEETADIVADIEQALDCAVAMVR